ncbi:aminotransferase class V-fold PLP-dependent enzyme [Novosphingobium resinovorum]|uniref:Cysteine desulfurase n=1 Tax=Novosphingobium resinovorum TaxID=158500 RepID=A0A1D8A1U7_9SPHN|nr:MULTISPECIES: aminotransferase class V-fold PLP-dependent enzyme [Sphingomonadaceae]AOR76108.1 aminotransferase [Novosphingobium resinovorum]EJU13179.1 cysteine desulfurase [Sphingomonas sp. LH128]MBF7011502.1 aminotransferase class V-fold PLP-dependent enzyme [Novosphingobium sp. HR1a]WJM29476.1 aminotransferase class V-fold PLP-dependent enzyme [Novosphingobium resinovorum]
MALPNIYLDHAATTPMMPCARDAWLEGAAIWANPSSPHAAGRGARAALEDARARVKAALDWQGEVIFTSGASEALALGLGRAKAERRLVSAVEHDAVFRAAPDAQVIPVREGEVDREALAAALAGAGRAVVAVQSVNSETGTALLSYADNLLAEQVRESGGLFLADCSQSAGKSALPDADMVVLSAHKLGGPIGIGALLVRDFAMIEPSGGQERGYRAGTENLPGALGFAAALEAGGVESWATSAEQRFDFRNRLSEHGEVIQPGVQCWHIFAVAAPKISATAMLIRMDAKGFAISAGSACSSGTLKQSRVLQGFGIDPDTAKRTVRISLGWSTTPDELDAFAQAWAEVNA